MENCRFCKDKSLCILHQDINRIVLKGGWELNHFRSDKRNILGRLVLAPIEPRKELANLLEKELEALGENLKLIEEALRKYWNKFHDDDVLEYVYVTYFKETPDSCVHLHILPRTKLMKELANYWGCSGIGWEYAQILDTPAFQGKYRIFKDDNIIDPEQIKTLMVFLKDYIKKVQGNNND